MPTPAQKQHFDQLMAVLTSRTKTQLKDMMFDATTPPVIAEIIANHPSLLGDALEYVGTIDENISLVAMTEEIIKAHGFKPTFEWEYECDAKTKQPQALRIWIGHRRTKKNMRTLMLTEEEATYIRPALPV